MKLLSALFVNLVFVSNAFAMAGQPGGAEGGQKGNFVGLILPMLVVFAIFYLLMIRPQQKQQKKLRAMLESLKKGDEVITRGGVHGRIYGIAENLITLEIADNVRIKINREFIAIIKNKDTATEKFTATPKA